MHGASGMHVTATPPPLLQPLPSVRAAAFRLFGSLARFSDGPSRGPFLEQVQTNFVSLLLHLNEEDPFVIAVSEQRHCHGVTNTAVLLSGRLNSCLRRFISGRSGTHTHAHTHTHRQKHTETHRHTCTFTHTDRNTQTHMHMCTCVRMRCLCVKLQRVCTLTDAVNCVHPSHL